MNNDTYGVLLSNVAQDDKQIEQKSGGRWPARGLRAACPRRAAPRRTNTPSLRHRAALTRPCRATAPAPPHTTDAP